MNNVEEFEELMEDLEGKYLEGSQGKRSYICGGFFADMFAAAGDVELAHGLLSLDPSLVGGGSYWYSASELTRKFLNVSPEDCYYKRIVPWHRAISTFVDKKFPKRKSKVSDEFRKDYSNFVDRWHELYEHDKLNKEQSKKAEEIYDEMSELR